MSRSLSCGPNPLNPIHMKPLERRAELCNLLALGLLRLRMKYATEVSAKHGEIPLHNPADQSAHAPPTQRRTA
ncbi:hypothetical protein [Roseovarius sp. Pro17]|uniref:hypothetical protein n=1 Tax=Roseovarius sp. Pro17 TaxID=3108175 RepID=UPI002D7722C2|nr:hypothetical protein [Roseovarius sp. Pro17]